MLAAVLGRFLRREACQKTSYRNQHASEELSHAEAFFLLLMHAGVEYIPELTQSGKERWRQLPPLLLKTGLAYSTKSSPSAPEPS